MDTLNQAIVAIITHEPIPDQQALLCRLNEKGEHVTQSTLSRRLKKLDVAKHAGVYVFPEQNRRSGAHALLSIEAAPPVFLVAHTLPGFANALAAQLDDCNPLKRESAQKLYSDSEDVLRCILGTIAGDDTVLIIAQEGTDLCALKERIKHFLK
jgi:transcriptional regulator of arginine metabolism